MLCLRALLICHVCGVTCTSIARPTALWRGLAQHIIILVWGKKTLWLVCISSITIILGGAKHRMQQRCPCSTWEKFAFRVYLNSKHDHFKPNQAGFLSKPKNISSRGLKANISHVRPYEIDSADSRSE